MRSFTKIVLGTGLALSMAVPFVTQAAGLTSDQVNSVIGLLQSFNVDANTISTVQAVLSGKTPEMHAALGTAVQAGATEPAKSLPSSTAHMMPPGQVAKAACITLARNLNVGSHGDDVKSLQKMLAEDKTSGFTATATGVFGPITAEAMKRFQMTHGIASSTTGAVGPATRAFFEHRCGNGLENNADKKPQPTATAAPHATALAVHGTALGDYLVASNGMTLYMSTKDTAGVSNCSDACAAAWPPYMATDTLVGRDGASGTLATLTRADGTKQVTYNGTPLYFYAGDAKVGDTTGQGVGGYWFVVKP